MKTKAAAFLLRSVLGTTMICALGVAAITFPLAAGQFSQPWNPETARSFHALTLEQLFAKYETGLESQKRSQAAYLHEITTRSNLVEFLSAQLKQSKTVPDSFVRATAREKAAYLIGKLGSQARPLVPLLVGALEDNDSVRRRVTGALDNLGPIAIEAKPVLLEELHFQNPLAAHALFKIDPTSESVLEAVLASLEDPSGEQTFRHQTVDALDVCKANPDRVRKFLQKLANETENPLRENAKGRLDVLDWKTRRYHPPQSPSAEPQQKQEQTNGADLLERLKNNPNDYQLAQTIARLDAGTKKQAVAILLDALREKRVRFPGNTVSTLGLFGAEAKAALPVLIEFAAGDDAGPANNAMATLGEIGPSAREAIPVVEGGLLDGSQLLRWRAANTLCLIDPDHLDVRLPTLLDNLKSDGAEEYMDFAVSSLGQFGPRASKAIPFLTRLLDNKSLRCAAGGALLKIQPEAGEKIARSIVADLESDSVHVRDRAAILLGEIGPAAAVALPDLEKAAAGDDADLAKLAKQSIAKISRNKEGI